MAGSLRTAHVRIEGRVQGVGYRLWTQRAAMELGLKGWVRNRRDGTVEAVFQGPEADVAAMIRHCQEGPAGAAVTRVEVMPERADSLVGFAVRETE